MDTTTEGRVEKLEQDVESLKRLATVERELRDLKSQTSIPAPRKRSGLRIFLLILAFIVVASIAIMPILADIIQAKFSAIATDISSGTAP